MSTAIKKTAEETSSGVKISKTTGGAYADMADVIESELGQILDKSADWKNARTRARVRSARLYYWRGRDDVAKVKKKA